MPFVVIPAKARYMQIVPTQTMKPPRLCLMSIYDPKPKYEASNRITLIIVSKDVLIAGFISYSAPF